MSKGKLLALTLVWLVIVAVLAVAWRWIYVPIRERARQQDQEELVEGTSGQSQYRFSLNLALDQFSGYAVLRSPQFQEQLHEKRIRVNLMDDGANYGQRLRRLREGEVQMAAFTIDALIKASAELGDLPAVIVAIIDETRGADAMVAYKQSVPNVDALNRPETRFVLTPDSPSETLARVVMTHFSLNRLPANPFVMTRGPEDTFNRYRQAAANSPEVYVIWEPFVSRILENENMHVVVDSSRFRGYIVDVLVVSRDYLLKNPDVVRDVVGCYFTAAYHHRQDMVSLVQADAQQQEQPLTPVQAQKLVEGIRWQNTQENFAYFGLRQDAGRQHIEDMIGNIMRVLLRTAAIPRSHRRATQPTVLRTHPGGIAAKQLPSGAGGGADRQRRGQAAGVERRGVAGTARSRRTGCAESGLRPRHGSADGTKPGRAGRTGHRAPHLAAVLSADPRQRVPPGGS